MATQNEKTIMFTSRFLYPEDLTEKMNTDDKNNFGILQVKTEQQAPQFKWINWVLNIDRSASMNDMCPDRKTKMEHIHYTIKNMVDYFIKLDSENENLTQYITIISFDHEATVLCENLLVNSNLKETIKNYIDMLQPRGSTNIDHALRLASENINSIITKFNATNSESKYHQISHLFMSDGHITQGISNSTEILRKYKESFNKPHIKNYNMTNTFIGFGAQHDASLMKTLSSIPKGEYYFVESLENAGMVYGEILYKSLYEYIQNLKLKIENGEIYNFKTNTWDETLDVDAISSGQTRTWHIRHANKAGASVAAASGAAGAAAGASSAAAASSVAAASGAAAASSVAAASGAAAASSAAAATDAEIINLPLTISGTCDIAMKKSITIPTIYPSYPQDKDTNVEKYLWRQKTQEIMREVEDFINNPPPHIKNTQTLYPGANNMVLPKPMLHHAHASPPAPPSKKVSFPQDMLLTEEHQILDAAKCGNWQMVWAYINMYPSLINSFPHPRKFNLIHHAIHQENVKALEKLVNMGGNTKLNTTDDETPSQLIAATTSPVIKTAMEKILQIAEHKQTAEHKQNDGKEITTTKKKTKREIETLLNNLMLEMKKYMADNDLVEDGFMKNLCDDIYVCTKSLTADTNLGNMYLTTRGVSQGNERAYNAADFTELDRGSQPIAECFRSLSDHVASTASQTAYAPAAATKMMRAVSSRT